VVDLFVTQRRHEARCSIIVLPISRCGCMVFLYAACRPSAVLRPRCPVENVSQYEDGSSN
jgi:hypothetical protein